MEDRVADLEKQVTALRISDAERAVVQQHVLDEMEKLSAAILSLTEAINKGKGALWVIGGLGVAVGSTVHYLLDFVQRMSK